MRSRGNPTSSTQISSASSSVTWHGDPEAVAVEAEHLGDELPRPRDGLGLEVVAEAAVAEHLEEGEVARRAADRVEVVVLAAGPHALLDRRRPRRVERHRLLAEEVRDELHHPRVGEHRRRRVGRDQAAPTGTTRVLRARRRSRSRRAGARSRVSDARTIGGHGAAQTTDGAARIEERVRRTGAGRRVGAAAGRPSERRPRSSASRSPHGAAALDAPRRRTGVRPALARRVAGGRRTTESGRASRAVARPSAGPTPCRAPRGTDAEPEQPLTADPTRISRVGRHRRPYVDSRRRRGSRRVLAAAAAARPGGCPRRRRRP